MLKGVHVKLITALGLDEEATLHQCLSELDNLKVR